MLPEDLGSAQRNETRREKAFLGPEGERSASVNARFLREKILGSNDKEAALAAGYSLSVAENIRRA